MESLSRHPLRRKDSATNGRVSSKTPFKDVGFSNWDRGKGKVFEARDYAEIFAGSSSIPVFDVSSLDERVESSEFRASNLDYSDVFGVMRNYDVAVAFEELLHHFDGSAKESNPCAAADRFMSSRDSGPRHSMMNGKRVSDKVPNHSADQDKEQFSMSFSGAHQQNANVSDKKKEEAYATDVRPRFSPKYEVNRAWSFTVQVESLNNKSQLNSRKSSDLNEVECGTQASNMPQTSSLNVSESSVKVLEQAKTSSLDSEGDISEVSAGEFSRPFFVEGYDEKSPAATSAAALKKAVDDAREKIRQAKFMMERRKKGNGDRSTRRQKIRTDQVANDSSESKSVNKDENSDPVFTPSAKYIDLVLNAGEGKTTKNVGMEKHGKNVERIEVCTKTTQFTGSNANEECRTLPGNIDVDCRFVPSGTVLASCADKLENGNGNSASVHNVKEPEAVVDKQSPRLSKEKMEVEKMVEEADQSSSNTIQVNDSGNVSETESIHASQKDQELGKVFDIAVENLRISLEDQGVNQGDKHSDGLGRENEKLCDFVVNEVPEKGEVGEFVLSISEVVHKPSSSQEELEIRLESNYQRDGNLEKKINNDPVMLQETEEVVRVNDFMQTEMDCKKQEDGGDVNQPELFRKCDEFEAEEIKLDTFVHEWVATNAADCSHFRNAFVVHDVATENSVVDAAGREDDQKFSATQETEFKSFTVESIHVSRSDSDLHRKAEEYEEAIRSSTGIHTTTSEIIGAYSMFYKEVEHEKLEQKRDPISEAQSLHQITSEENHAESKVCNGFGGVSDSLIYSAGPVENEQVGVDASKTTPLIPDASRNSAADVLKAPVVDSRTRGINLGQVRNSEEQTPDCRSSSPATCVQDYADGLSGSESEGSKQGTTSAQEELKDKSGMVDEAVSDEGSCNANSDVDAKQTNGTEKYAETNLEMQKDKDFVGEKGAKESFPPNFVENDQQQRIEAIRKGREREKDRLAVERAIREARERAKEKLERAAAEKQQAEKAATEAKLRAERAAVERATAEARERAFEKAKSLKTFTTTRSLAAEKIPMPSRNDGLKHSFSSSDLEVVATYTESAQRRKARLERHQRVMERAAKALEEKNKRDLLVQKEQAERNRMAEFLDADIKRWSAGKEGNLRALLSTLHYILSAESGWRAVSLTEIITTADVKKAYRKATLCVHPDKLQQRGASVQQKYICEKVFDLLKAAWNKFNSEER